jgi:molybdopterin-binding protein
MEWPRWSATKNQWRAKSESRFSFAPNGARLPETANRESPAVREGRIKTRLNVKSNRVMSSSIRNRLPGTVEKIVSDKVVSEIVIRTAAGEVTSVITTGSVQRMNLKEGDQVSAIIKATEVSIEKE